MLPVTGFPVETQAAGNNLKQRVGLEEDFLSTIIYENFLGVYVFVFEGVSCEVRFSKIEGNG